MAQEPYLISREYGRNLEETIAFIKKHEAFEKSAAQQEERFLALEKLTTVVYRRWEKDNQWEILVRIETNATTRRGGCTQTRTRQQSNQRWTNAAGHQLSDSHRRYVVISSSLLYSVLGWSIVSEHTFPFSSINLCGFLLEISINWDVYRRP